MTGKQAFFFGALGGVLPILANLLTIDIAAIIDQNTLTLGNYIGFAIRVLLLIGVGGAVALMNTDVRQPLALVQLGIAAPALVTAYINGASPPKHAMFEIVSTANAAELAEPRTQLAGSLSDIVTGLSTRLDVINSMNRGVGSFCVTGQGKAPLGAPAAKIGSQCTVQTPGGPSSGLVTN